MKDDSNKQKTINEQSELNLSFYFGFEESSSTESQNQKQLKAVQLYTVSGDEHSQGERPCALPQSVEFEYLEEPIELVPSSYNGCDCKGCQSYKIELENAYEKIAAGSVLNLEFYKKIKLYQNDEPLNYVDVRYRQGTYLIAHLYTLIVMVVASEIHLMPSAFLLSLIVGSAIALFAFYDESDNKF